MPAPPASSAQTHPRQPERKEDRTEARARLRARVRAAMPNALTGARVVMAGLFVMLLAAVRLPEAPAEPGPIDQLRLILHPASSALVVAAALFVLAAMTDALDGHLARRWNAVTRFGRVMDPFADKLLVLGAFVMLASPVFSVPGPADQGRPLQLSGVEGWMVIVLLARELLVTSLRGVLESEGIDFSAGLSGKLKMVLQSIAVPIVLLLVAMAWPVPGTPARTVVLALVWTTTIVTAASALPYIVRALTATRATARATPRTTTDRTEPPQRVEIPVTHVRKRQPRKRPGPNAAGGKGGQGGRKT
ncbi:MAG: CDP-alcohol phosphatidyltransferase family protein [Planctomycetota bacterium]